MIASSPTAQGDLKIRMRSIWHRGVPRRALPHTIEVRRGKETVAFVVVLDRLVDDLVAALFRARGEVGARR